VTKHNKNLNYISGVLYLFGYFTGIQLTF